MILAFSSVSRREDSNTQNPRSQSVCLCAFLPWFLVSVFSHSLFSQRRESFIVLSFGIIRHRPVVSLLFFIILLPSSSLPLPFSSFLTCSRPLISMVSCFLFAHHELYSLSHFCSFIPCPALVISFSTSPNNDDNDDAHVRG